MAWTEIAPARPRYCEDKSAPSIVVYGKKLNRTPCSSPNCWFLGRWSDWAGVPRHRPLLRDLEATECVTRSPDKDDGRRTIVSLTPHGRQMLHGYRERREQWLAMAMEADLSRDELALLMEAGKLMERLAQHGSQVDSSIARRKTK